jgi:hypothetical protein
MGSQPSSKRNRLEGLWGTCVEASRRVTHGVVCVQQGEQELTAEGERAPFIVRGPV